MLHMLDYFVRDLGGQDVRVIDLFVPNIFSLQVFLPSDTKIMCQKC